MTSSTATLPTPIVGTRPISMRALPAAGAIYVVAWLVGLVIAPPAPNNGAAASDIHAYFSAHASASVVQSLLVHGLAGLALVALTLGLSRAVATDPHASRNITRAGLAAASVSFIQVAFALAAANNVPATSASTTAAWFHAINYADTVKLMLLAAFAATVTHATRHTTSRWLRATGWALVPLLILGGIEFVIDNITLSAALDLSLIALLIWAGGTAWQIGRRTA